LDRQKIYTVVLLLLHKFAVLLLSVFNFNVKYETHFNVFFPVSVTADELQLRQAVYSGNVELG